uniref:Uncharacterized protein n=1 Tax=Parastrongyloides trichosuri TaxID=131310 RepID=A0A0N4ZLR5_PARTI
MAKQCSEDVYTFGVTGVTPCACGGAPNRLNVTVVKCDSTGFSCSHLATTNNNLKSFWFGATANNSKNENFNLKLKIEYTCCCPKFSPTCLREMYKNIPDDKIHCGGTLVNVAEFGTVKLPMGTRHGLGVGGPLGRK